MYVNSHVFNVIKIHGVCVCTNLTCAPAVSLFNCRSGDDRRVDHVVLVLVSRSPAGSLPPVLVAQRGVVDRLLRLGPTV